MSLWLPVPVALTLLAVLVAAVADVWKFKVHNLLTLPLLALGLVYHAVTGGLTGLTDSLLGALAGFALLLPLFLLNGMGAGDVKLMAGVGAWLGAAFAFLLFLASGLAAGVYALVLILFCGQWRSVAGRLRSANEQDENGAPTTEDRVAHAVSRSDRRKRAIPFAAMMAVGLVAILAWAWVTGPQGP